MDFKKYNVTVDDVYKYDDSESISTLSLSGGNIPIIAGFTISNDSLPTPLVKGQTMSVYLQAMADKSGRFELYKDEEEFRLNHTNSSPESFFPEWETDKDGSHKYVEFANIDGKIVDITEFDGNNWLVKLLCQGFEISTLIPKNMPALCINADYAYSAELAVLFNTPSPELSWEGANDYNNFNKPNIGDTISGEFLLTFDLNSPS